MVKERTAATMTTITTLTQKESPITTLKQEVEAIGSNITQQTHQIPPSLLIWVLLNQMNPVHVQCADAY